MRTRLVQIDDATALMNILNPEVIELEVSFDLVPKSLEEQREWIRDHQGTHICLVAVNTEDDVGEVGAQGERILGFASVSPFRERPAYATTVENSIYVHRRARGRGVGEVLLNDLISAARTIGVSLDHRAHRRRKRGVDSPPRKVRLHPRGHRGRSRPQAPALARRRGVSVRDARRVLGRGFGRQRLLRRGFAGWLARVVIDHRVTNAESRPVPVRLRATTTGSSGPSATPALPRGWRPPGR